MITLPGGRYHSIECACSHGKALSSEAAERAKKKKALNDKKKQSEYKKETARRRRELNRSDVRWQHKNTQPRFNRMRVLEELSWFKERGIEPYCISCLKKDMDWCCGHFKTVGSQGRLRYDRKNTYLQCNRYCNMALSGNISGNKNTVGYTKGLIHRFGEEEAMEIINYCESNQKAKKWTTDELENIRSSANQEIRGLERLMLGD